MSKMQKSRERLYDFERISNTLLKKKKKYVKYKFLMAKTGSNFDKPGIEYRNDAISKKKIKEPIHISEYSVKALYLRPRYAPSWISNRRC